MFKLPLIFLTLTAVTDTHLKQKLLARERKLAKPNARLIERSKKIWERLRLKSHVPRDERKQLVSELYEIITGRVKDFVFKHDSVRVIQTALKYGTLEQRKAICVELKGSLRDLAESKYGKFLLAKLVVHGDSEIRDLIIPEFYGNIRKLMRHPEASWIVDDIYRMTATTAQKSQMLREWYGPEFTIFLSGTGEGTADLADILENNPEKRGPIMQHLLELINLLVQKKTTGFTMLHDAMLQYFLNTKAGSTEAAEFLELLRADDDGNLVKNLAFTNSGSRLMCLALAHSNAKERKALLRIFRDMIPVLAEDVHAHNIILTAYEVIDDTKLTSKLIFPELFCETLSESERHRSLLQYVSHPYYKIPLLYLFGGHKLAWLLSGNNTEILEEVFKARQGTSKKDPNVRRDELVTTASPIMLEFVASTAESLMGTSSGCRCITEVLLGAKGDKEAALAAVAAVVKNNPAISSTASVGRMLKSLVHGGRFNADLRKIETIHPPLRFDALLYEHIRNDIPEWIQGPNPFVVVALVEAADFEKRAELIGILEEEKLTLQQLAKSVGNGQGDDNDTGRAKSAAANLLLALLGVHTSVI